MFFIVLGFYLNLSIFNRTPNFYSRLNGALFYFLSIFPLCFVLCTCVCVCVCVFVCVLYNNVELVAVLTKEH